MRLRAIDAKMPSHSDTARYILAQLLSEAECLICGNNAPAVVQLMKSRIDSEQCVVCGSRLNGINAPDHVVDAANAAADHYFHLEEIDDELAHARGALAEADEVRKQIDIQVQRLETDIVSRSARLDRLLKQLPPAESEMHERRRELAARRARASYLQTELEEKRTNFARAIASANVTIAEHALAVQSAFGDYAEDFLLEDCGLLWSPQRARLGQTGQLFEFPAFALNLGGGGFSSTMSRHGPDDVSESQREFIDLSFRMALAKVATEKGTTSLVMDAPESSLDVVFDHRAARVLGTFGRPDAENRLVITSNLVSGRLIPELLRISLGKDFSRDRIVDLLDIAAPTAALRQFRDDYEEAREHLLDLSGEDA